MKYSIKKKKLVIALTLPVLAVYVYLCVMAVLFNYAHSINWESAARLKSNLLNEAILDDGQALYRVRDMKRKN